MWRYLLLFFMAACGLPEAGQLPPLSPHTPHPVRVAAVFQGLYHCSGVEVHKDWALTARHCVEDAMWVDGLPVSIAIVPNPDWDMAVMHVPGLRGPDVEWTDHKPVIGETSMLIGWGCSPQHTEAVVKLAQVEEVDGRDITYNTRICEGDSGGPVFDSKERLVGLIKSMYEDNHHAVVQYLGEEE